jgi:FemAB-related protein (PEP-CTERM system-associated)
MPLNIKIANPSDKQRWDQYVLKHPNGIAYQLFAWKEAVEQAYGFRGVYLIAQNNNRVVGILPLIHVKLPFLPGNLVSLPYCDAGGPLADSSDIEKQLLLKALDILKAAGIKTLTIRSIQKFADIDPGLTKNKEKARMILELPESSDALLSSLKAKVRSQVKKPMKDGLSFQSGGLEFLNEFYPLFSENMRDLGSPVHSKKWLKSVLSAYKNRSQLFIVKTPDQTPAAGGILLCHPKIISVPWASSLRRFNRWNPNMLLYWAFLKFASDNHYPAFDFGRSTPGEGTFRFKKQWGAIPKSLHWADFKIGVTSEPVPVSSFKKTADNGKAREVAEQVLQKLPLPISKVLGSTTRKYISL